MKKLSPSDYYITPDHILDAILEKIGRDFFDTDPCPGKLSNGQYSVPAVKYCTDGLSEGWLPDNFEEHKQPWYIFCKPPYSQKSAWIKKGIETLKNTPFPVCIFYLMPNSTDSEWYHLAPFSHEWHSRKRIRFIDPSRRYTEGKKPRNGSILGVMANYDNPPHNFYVGHPGTWSTQYQRMTVVEPMHCWTTYYKPDKGQLKQIPATLANEDQKLLDVFEHTPAGVLLFEG